jgi:hypothetical protein
MMPVMQFRSANEHAQRTEREAHIGVDINCPKTTEGEHSGDGFERESHDKCGQVDQTHRINGVDGMLAMGCQPIKMLGAVMNGMEAPEKTDPVLQPVAPIHAQVAK